MNIIKVVQTLEKHTGVHNTKAVPVGMTFATHHFLELGLRVFLILLKSRPMNDDV